MAGLSLGICEKVPHQQLERSLNRTIDTVEKIIQSDPTLPRLNRDDILKILLNLTSGSPEMEEFTRPTALPLTATSQLRTDKEQSTNSPLVQLIPDSTEADAIIEIGKTEEIIFPPNPKDPSPFVEKAEKYIAEQSAPSITNSSIKVECKTVTTDSQNNHRNSYSELNGRNTHSNASFTDGTSQQPEKFTFNLANLDQITKSAHQYISSVKSSADNRTSSTQTSNPEKVAVVYSTSLQTDMNNEAKSVTPFNYPQLYNQNPNVFRTNQWRYSEPIVMNAKSSGMESGIHFLPTIPNFSSGNMKPYFELPKKVSGNQPDSHNDMNRPSPVYVTPVSASNEAAKIPEQNTQGNVPKNSGFSINTKIETSVKPIDFLQSLGLKMEEKENNQAESTKFDTNNVELRVPTMESTKFNLPLISDAYNQITKPEDTKDVEVSGMSDEFKNVFTNKGGNIKNFNEPSGLSAFDFDSLSINKQNTFLNPMTNFKKGVDNLTPDVQNLFHRFGLPTSVLRDMIENRPKITTTTRRPTTTTPASFSDYFTSFKRLPSSKVENEEMRDFLAQFGLGNSETRKQKAMKSSDLYTQQPSKQSSFDIRKALDNIGLLALVPRSDEVTPTPKRKRKPTKSNVFKPHESLSSSAEQREKIHKLLDTVKMVQEGNVEDVQKVVEDLVETTKSLKSGPDPVNLDEIIRIYKEETYKQDKKFQRQAIFNETSEESTSLGIYQNIV